MALRADTIREFGELFEREEPPRAQTHRAVVTAVDGGTVYVDVSGNGDATPIETTSAGYAIGDEVQVEQRGGRLHVSGNVTQPSVGAQHVEQAVAPVARTAAQAQSASRSAQRAADEAAEVANAVNQHFFDDSDGIHVTEADRDTWTAQHSGKNILINSLGILLRNALNNLVSITASAIAFFDGSGNAASNVVAQFGASGAQIGKSGESHMELDYRSIQMVDKDAETYFHVSDLLDRDNKFHDWFVGDGTTQGFVLSYSPPYGSEVVVKVDGSTATGVTVAAFNIVFDTAPASGASIEAIYSLRQSDLNNRWTKGFTFGKRNALKTVGPCSVAFGIDNVASAKFANAEGYGTEASGNYSAARNMGTTACFKSQTAIGEYNERDVGTGIITPDERGTYAFIIGNGTSDNARSNAFMVDWDGYIYPMEEKMPDWVVEQGTSGIWTYRKWHSGIAECWGIHTASFAVSTSSATYGGYRSAEQTATFPSGLFTSTPSATATGGAGYVGCWVSNAQSTSSTAFKFFASCGTSLSSSSRSTHIHAIGKWK